MSIAAVTLSSLEEPVLAFTAVVHAHVRENGSTPVTMSCYGIVRIGPSIVAAIWI